MPTKTSPVQTSAQIPPSENPHFHHCDRAPYELGYLLRQLPPVFDPFFKLTPETHLIAEAAVQHASNANDTLIHGLEALGHFIYVAGDNDDAGVDMARLADLGCLIQHMAAEMQFLQETEGSLRNAVRVHQEQSSKEGK